MASKVKLRLHPDPLCAVGTTRILSSIPLRAAEQTLANVSQVIFEPSRTRNLDF
jgi:hypothetical protein